MSEQPKTDPLVKATRKAYRQSRQYELDQLLAEESRWKRKSTIAQNKLADVRNRINKFAQEGLQNGQEDKPASPAS